MSNDSRQLSPELQSIKQRCRLLMLITALERVGIAPVSMSKLHAFAYLADVLSPVWGFVPYDGAVLKMKEGPHYTELQKELDALVILGLVNVLSLRYISVGKSGARIDGLYELRFEAKHLPGILNNLGAVPGSDALDPTDSQRNLYLVELAGALAVLPDDEIDAAARFDATYADEALSASNVIELDRSVDAGPANKSVAVTSKFQDFLPQNSAFSPGEKIYLYASYLNRKIHA